MPAYKLRYLILFLIFALTLGIWSMRTTVAELVITSFLRSSGLEDVTVNIHQLDQNQSQLPHFEFSLSTATGWLQFNVTDTSISYNLDQLADGRVNSIVINNLELHYQNTDEIQVDSTDEPAISDDRLQPLKLIVALRSALRKYLLVNTLFVRHITVHGEAFTALQGKIFQLKATAKNGSLDNELSLLDQSSIIQSVVVRLSADQLAAELRQTTADVIPAKVELNINDSSLTGEFFIKPLALQNWLKTFASRAFTGIDGLNKTEKINGVIAFNFESDTQFKTILTAESKKLIYETYTADNAVIKLKIKNTKIDPLQRLQIENGSYIKAGNISYRGFSLADSRIYMVGELTDAFNSWAYKGGFSSSLLTAHFQSRELQVKDVAAQIVASAKKLNGPAGVPPRVVGDR